MSSYCQQRLAVGAPCRIRQQIGARLPPEYAIPSEVPSPEEARAYCRRLAHRHYENFSVATWFLPKRLRQHFCNVYAYCRISDDLGDEVGRCADFVAAAGRRGRTSWMPAIQETLVIRCLLP